MVHGMCIGMTFCPLCGTKAEPDQLFCENCGNSLQEPAQPTASLHVPQESPPADTPPSPPVNSPSAPPSKEPVSQQPLSGFKKYKLPIIAIACILLILIVFLALPKGPSPQPVNPYKTVATYSTPVPSPSAAQPLYTTKPFTTVTTSAAVSGQVSGGAVSTTEYSPSSRAQFRANRTTGPAPLTISFYDLTLGSPGKWVWDFGDTSGSSERNPVHTYKSPGKYTVTMNAVISGSMYSNSMDITVTGN
jgi:hypothetical protein